MRGWVAFAVLLIMGGLLLAPVASAGSGDVDVAVLDSGINPDHNAFCDGQVEVWEDLVNGRLTPYDDRFHGTATASRVGGQDPAGSGFLGSALGANPCVDLHIYKVTNDEGRASFATVTDAIYKAVENGAEVISISLSGSIPFPPASISESGAVDYATDHDVLVVSSAGNDGELSPDDTDPQPGTVIEAAGHGPTELYPGRNSADALVVGASTGDGERADFSQRDPEVLSDGSNVWVAHYRDEDGAFRGSGTSYSTPWVAGQAARLLEAGAPQDPGWLKWVLLHSARDDPAKPYANEGYGILDEKRIDQAFKVARGEEPVPGPDHRDAAHLASLGLRTATTGDVPIGLLPPFAPAELDPK